MPTTDADDESLHPQELWEINRPVRVAKSRNGPATDLTCADYLISNALLTLSEWEALMHELIPSEAHANACGQHEIGQSRIGQRMLVDEKRGVVTFPCGYAEFEQWVRSCDLVLPSVLIGGIAEARDHARRGDANSPLPSLLGDMETPTATRLDSKGVDEKLNKRANALAKTMFAEHGLLPKRNAVARRLSEETGMEEATVKRRIRKTW